MLKATEFSAKCDVHGCTNLTRGSLLRIKQDGWAARLIYSGKIEMADIEETMVGSAANIICPTCALAGAYKDMVRIIPPVVEPSGDYVAVGPTPTMEDCMNCAGQGNVKPDGLTIKPCPLCKGKKKVLTSNAVAN